MKYKLILLGVALLITSGCEAVYTLELDSNNATEKLEINNYDKSTWNTGNPKYSQLIDLASTSCVATNYQEEKPELNEKLPGVTYYKIDKINKKDNLGLVYSYNFKNEYKNSTIIFNNTDNFIYKKTKDTISINSGIINLQNHPNLNNLTIRLNTNHNVIHENSDEIKDGVYYWYFNENNYKNKKVDIELSTSFEKKELKILELDEEGYFGKSTLITIYIIIFIILVAISGVVIFKVRSSNQ